ncbi:helix-turn-helix domain-containing protein [Pontibacillus salipaludis]|uniref:helix-turn-helix domain-containing protein n=1 Tax=Pontibacillus salipaludis TaxID=1697394 RepID=UPI0031E5EC8C
MEETLGEKLKSLRKKLQISQEALAKGICTQSEISRIENNNNLPSYQILSRLAQKLGVRISYFKDDHLTHRGDYVDEVKHQLNIARRERNYDLIQTIVVSEKDVPAFKSGTNKKYLDWHKGIALFHKEQKLNEAIEVLNNCLSRNRLSDLHTALDMNVLNSLGVLYRNAKKPYQAKEYLQHSRKIAVTFSEFREPRLYIKILYNLSKALTDLEEHIESVDFCDEAIDYCIKEEDMFLLGELHYQVGRNYISLGRENEGIQYWGKALNVFELQKKDFLYNMVQQEIEHYRNYKNLI